MHHGRVLGKILFISHCCFSLYSFAVDFWFAACRFSTACSGKNTMRVEAIYTRLMLSLSSEAQGSKPPATWTMFHISDYIT